MGKINLLEKYVAELIAAGEVVDRPASVIKELTENSIDAGATVITIEIKDGGTSYMRVTDNGSGIEREDVPTAFLRHATSKIKTSDDLDSIATLGFRGEALASIAAVSRVELFTRTQQELAGTYYVIAGGEELQYEDVGCAVGTTIIVRDIFYNTPARMKFLKKDMVEANAVAAIIDKLALSHPEVSIRFLRNGKETLHTPGDKKLKSAIYAVFGKEFTSGLIPVSYDCGGVKVEGFVSKPSCARPNRSMQQFFINGRFIKSRTAMVALEEAFKGSLMVGKFPACVLQLQLSCEAVDVNVHPTKLEVRFINERPIFDAVYHGVKTALNKWDSPKVMNVSQILDRAPTPSKPALDTNILDKKRSVQVPIIEQAPIKIENHVREESKENLPKNITSSLFLQNPVVNAKRGYPGSSTNIDIEYEEEPEQEERKSQTDSLLHDSRQKDNLLNQEEISQQIAFMDQSEPQKEAEKIPEPTFQEEAETLVENKMEEDKFLGEVFGTYIMVQRGNDELIFIDKHAAHERMLYEKLKKEQNEAFCQFLIEPITVTLDKNEYAAVLDSLEIYAQAGFELEDFGAGSILIRSAPLSLAKEDAANAVLEIAGYLASAKTDITTEKLDWLYHNIACRAAVKSGDENSPEELIALVHRLEQNPEIRYCPHGRPVSITMKKKDLEKQFGRI